MVLVRDFLANGVPQTKTYDAIIQMMTKLLFAQSDFDFRAIPSFFFFSKLTCLVRYGQTTFPPRVFPEIIDEIRLNASILPRQFDPNSFDAVM